MIDTVRLSEKARIQLINLKRRTGLQNWNVLCRWAFCVSMSEPSVPPHEVIPSDSSLEMSWKVFTGGYEDVYFGILLARARRDGIAFNKESLIEYFRLHLHRGISYLNGSFNVRGIGDLLRIAGRGPRMRAT